MNKILLSLLAAALLAGASLAQTAAGAQAGASASSSSSVSASPSGAQVQSQSGAQADSQSALSTKEGNHSAKLGASDSNQLASGSAIHAQLEKPVDARKCKPGDEVVAKTTQSVKSHGEVIVPKGSRIVGHVTEAKARAKGQSESAVGIAFDHAVLKDGREVPLAASIQAISSSQASGAADFGGDSAAAAEDTGGMASGAVAAPAGGVLGGAGRAVGTTGGVLANTSSTVGGAAGGTLHGATSASGALSSTSHGVVGLNGLSLNSVAENSTQGSLITSNTQNVHLDSGTQMILHVK
jgi:hypothetical protein